MGGDMGDMGGDMGGISAEFDGEREGEEGDEEKLRMSVACSLKILAVTVGGHAALSLLIQFCLSSSDSAARTICFAEVMSLKRCTYILEN